MCKCYICIVLCVIAWIGRPFESSAQLRSGRVFGNHLVLSTHYGAAGDFLYDRESLYDREQFLGLRAAISVAPNLYAGIQVRRIWAQNFESPIQVFYMAGIFGRAYFLHPVWTDMNSRLGVFLETGFMKGNYAYFYKNQSNIRYFKENPGSWYIPCLIGLEYHLGYNFTLQAAIHAYYNNGGNWNEQGIAYPSFGINWHGW
jgi:hypothetical protein